MIILPLKFFPIFYCFSSKCRKHSLLSDLIIFMDESGFFFFEDLFSLQRQVFLFTSQLSWMILTNDDSDIVTEWYQVTFPTNLKSLWSQLVFNIETIHNFKKLKLFCKHFYNILKTHKKTKTISYFSFTIFSFKNFAFTLFTNIFSCVFFFLLVFPLFFFFFFHFVFINQTISKK